VVLAEVVRRLSLILGADDTLARLTRDQSVVICEDLTGRPAQIQQQLRALRRRIQRDLRRPPSAREVEVVVSVSIGVAIATRPRSVPDLINAADRAVHRANQRGRGQLFFSQPQAAPRVPGQTV
jgi:GGDEF domain-containing protein